MIDLKNIDCLEAMKQMEIEPKKKTLLKIENVNFDDLVIHS